MRNFFWIGNVVVKICVLVITLYEWNKVNPSIFVTFLGVLGIIWALSSGYDEYRFENIEQRLKQLEKQKRWK